MTTQETRLAEIRSAIEAENVSYGELAELQDIAAKHPELFADDPRLAEAAGIPEEQWNQPLTRTQQRENARRRKQAAAILAQYAEMAGQPEEDRETNLGDLLADCLHLMGADAVERCARSGLMHYEAERKGEE